MKNTCLPILTKITSFIWLCIVLEKYNFASMIPFRHVSVHFKRRGAVLTSPFSIRSSFIVSSPLLSWALFWVPCKMLNFKLRASYFEINHWCKQDWKRVSNINCEKVNFSSLKNGTLNWSKFISNSFEHVWNMMQSKQIIASLFENSFKLV